MNNTMISKSIKEDITNNHTLLMKVLGMKIGDTLSYLHDSNKVYASQAPEKLISEVTIEKILIRDGYFLPDDIFLYEPDGNSWDFAQNIDLATRLIYLRHKDVIGGEITYNKKNGVGSIVDQKSKDGILFNPAVSIRIRGKVSKKILLSNIEYSGYMYYEPVGVVIRACGSSDELEEL